MYVLVGLTQVGFKVLDTEDGSVDECSLDELSTIVLGGTKVHGITSVPGVHSVNILGRNIVSQNIRILDSTRNKFINSVVFTPLPKAVSPKFKYYFRVGYTDNKYSVQILAYSIVNNKIIKVFSFVSATPVELYNYECEGNRLRVVVYTTLKNMKFYAIIDYDISTRKAQASDWVRESYGMPIEDLKQMLFNQK